DPTGPNGGWMEILGSGMVNPKVIEHCGLDPDEWQGFAFGCGIDRLAMLKYGMDDLRAFFDGDLRWLKHYGFSSLDVPTLSGGVGA
ncbi:MAG: tRNA ligase subunit PheS family protein, partial [Blastomonas fulva]